MYIKKNQILFSLALISCLCAVIVSGCFFATKGVFNKRKEVTVIIDAGHER